MRHALDRAEIPVGHCCGSERAQVDKRHVKASSGAAICSS